MYRYCYKKLQSHMDGWGPFNGNLYSLDNYRDTIDEMARQGWRYVGYMPTVQRGTGHIEELELIFEQKTGE